MGPESEKRLLKAAAFDFAPINRGAPYEVGGLSLVQQHVTWNKAKGLKFSGSKVHVFDVAKVEFIFQHIGDPEVGPHIFATVVLGRALSTQRRLARLRN